MKTRILLVICIAIGIANLAAQDLSPSNRPRRTYFEIIAGPTYTHYETPEILPSLNYQVGMQTIRKLGRSSVQLGVQYLPMEAAFAGFTLKTVNHMVSSSLSYKLRLTSSGGITLDLGTSYGVSVAQSDSYAAKEYIPRTPLGLCGTGPFIAPELSRRQFSLLVGLSWSIANRYKVALTASMGHLISKSYYDFHPTFVMFQGLVGYRIF